ncbi:MAG: tetratricopeptide repeat protein [Microscillaceae bacterium]|nr:tetratricopeptide repeat protein [Microscillaceae bacterium]MDW8460017.1 tetratricopeptide repeat protein [Cytophagales bacterium]
MKKLLCLFCLAFAKMYLFAQTQDVELAEQYFTQNEFEKALAMYEKVAKYPQHLASIYKNYLATLIQLKQWKEAEKLTKKMTKDYPEDFGYKVDAAWLLELQGKTQKAEEEYNKLINDNRKNSEQTIQLANKFLKLAKPELAEKTYLQARKTNRDKNAFAAELAEVYGIMNSLDAMINEYLNMVINDKTNLEFVRGALQDHLSKQEDYDKLERILLDRLQKDSSELTYNELLLWLYLQQKLFHRAFIQARAIDRRYKLEGSEILNIGNIAMKNGDYKSAMTMFEYIVKEYPRSSNYSIARNYYLKAKEQVVTQNYPIVKEEVQSLVQDYDKLITELGKSYHTTEAMRSKALLLAFYLDEKDKAIEQLNEAIELAKSNLNFVAQCKIDLGDIYLLKGEDWESTLLYSQVEKMRKDSPLGYEAKLRNAKLSYFKGDFELAQEHLDILKEATTREIANDAMELSLLIQDNTVFDTLGLALKEYAHIELLIFQHKADEALERLDKMLKDFPNHSLTDEIYYQRAKILLKMGKYEQAIQSLEKILALYPDDILGDDANFLIGKIYEENLKNKEKAMEYYKAHLTKYPASVYLAEARKRFRILRGDVVN